MIKLKTIIGQLQESTFKTLARELEKNRSANFLYLLNSYRSGRESDAQISEHLQITNNSLYVLKSRLYDKIQDKLTGDIFSTREEALKRLHQIPEILCGQSREMATAFLQKLEKDLLAFDMHNELLSVYSALKKVHFYSDKFFHYSQQYNRHAAYNLSLEKSEELLANFVRTLAEYNFGRTENLLTNLMFLKKQILDHYSLNASRQIHIIKNFATLQLNILFNVHDQDFDAEDVLQKTKRIIDELPEGSQQRSWMVPLDYLFLEYYQKSGNRTQVTKYLPLVENQLSTLLLFNHVALTSRFLVTRWQFPETLTAPETDVLYDANDLHSMVHVGINRCVTFIAKKNYKEAALTINQILNEASLKDHFHFNVELRLTLAFIYLLQEEFDLAEYILKNLSRKIKAEQPERYAHVIRLIKLFNYEIKQAGKIADDQRDEFLLFQARNKKETSVLAHLKIFLEHRYN